jgi:hypothetical protein
VQVIAALRRLRMTGAEIAECLGMPLSTVSGILARIGMGKLGRLGFQPAVRYASMTRTTRGNVKRPINILYRGVEATTTSE